jgi:Holliday junction resolvase RusA-like endonuclease
MYFSGSRVGVRILTKKARELKNYIKAECRKKKAKLMKGKVKVEYIFQYKGKRAFDVDNQVKLIQDALQGIVYENDTDIHCMIATKLVEQKEDAVAVKITSLYDSAITCNCKLESCLMCQLKKNKDNVPKEPDIIDLL